MCLSRNASETCTWSFYVSAVSFYVARLHGLHVHVKFADIRFQYKGLKVSLQVYMHVQVCHPIKEFGRVWHRRSCQTVQYVCLCRNSIHDYLCSMLQYYNAVCVCKEAGIQWLFLKRTMTIDNLHIAVG